MADYKGLNIRFRGDTTDAAKALNVLSAEAKAAQGNLSAVEGALKNATTNGRNLNDALKSVQLQQMGNAASAAAGKVDAYRQVLVGLNERLQEAQRKLVTNRDALESMPAKYDALASSASSAFERVAQAQAALDAAKEKVEYAGTQQSWVQAVNEQAEAQANLNAAISAGDEEFAKLSARYGTLQGAVNSATETIQSTGAEIERTTQKMLVQESQAKSLAAEQARLAASMTGMGEWGANAQEFGRNLQNVGNALSSIGDKMTLVSGIAAMTFGRNVISSTEEFGNAIAQLGGYLDIQGAQLDEMSDQALKWGKDTQFSATEAANAMNELAKGGMTQAQISGGAMQATMELAAAGSLDMAQAAETAVQAIKTFGLSAEDSRAIADALAGAANKSTAEVTDLAQGFKYVGGWASMANWNINDVSGALALLSDHGLKSEMAGTALRNVMQRLAAPTDTAAELMKQYGFSVRDAEGHMVSATEVVKRLNDTFGEASGLSEEERQNVLSDIFGARALPAAIALMDEGADKLQGYIDATTEAGYAGEMAQSRMGELGWALEMLRGEAETAAVNFGQALTPTIKGVAEAIEGALEWFNSLSDAQKTQIANFALMAAAAGPVLSVTGHLASGIGELLETFGKGVVNIAQYNEMVKAGVPSAEALSASVGTTATALANFGLAALAAYGAMEAIGTVKGVVEEFDLVRDATTGMSDAIATGAENLEAYASAQATAASEVASTSEMLATANEGLKDATKLTNDIGDAFSTLAENSALVDQYASTMKELSSQSELTAAQQEELKNAVEQYNGITGAAVEVTDATSGALSLLSGQIDEVTEAYKRQAEQKAYADLYNEAVKTRISEQQKLKEVTDQLTDSNRKLTDEVRIGTDVFTGLKNLKLSAENAKLVTSYDGLIKSVGEATKAEEYFKSMMESTPSTFSDLRAAMTSAGVTGEQYKGLTQEQLAELEASFDGTLGSISGKLRQFGVSVKGVGDTMVDAAGDVTSGYADALTNGIDEGTQEAQKALKRQNDAIYREAQRNFDAEYKALQKSLDAAYKAQQKAYDAEYKALQKQLDREYKEYQKAYDKEYKQRQKQLDAQYDAYKKSLDAEESALKKQLDAKTDALKKQLDDELKAVKKANDQRLKEQKKADEAETKAFKAETDRRVAALQAEYKARLKLLEAQYGGSDIDAQIKDLKSQTKAEQDEIKRRDQQEKKAELEKAVEQAKTRRKRADAEKALNDYLAELAQEQREREREAQIERLEDQKDALKDELAAKKDALKEEYDARIAALKEQRAAELEVIKEANDQEYETLKEQLDGIYQARKEANDAKIEQAKEANQLEIDNLKEHHSLLLENMKEQHTLQLEQLKEQQQEQLDQIKEGQQAQLEGLKESQQAALDAMKESQQAQLESLKQSQQDQLQALRDSLDDQLDAVKTGGASKVRETQATNKTIVDDAKATTKNLATDLNDRFKKAKEHLKKSASEYQSGSERINQNFLTPFQRTMPQVNTVVNATHNYANDKLRSMRETMARESQAGNDSMARNFENGKNSASRSVGDLRDTVRRQLEPLPSEMGDAGTRSGDGFARGIGNASGSAASAARNVASAAVREFDSVQNWTETSGWNAGINFANGLSRTQVHAESAAGGIAAAVASLLHHSTPDKGPLHGDDRWGYELVDNLINGMASKESELALQTRRLASIVSDEFAPTMDADYSVRYDARPMVQLLTSGVTEALRSGIPQRQGLTIVVKEMHVRDESDIRRVSQRLYQLEAQSNRRGL